MQYFWTFPTIKIKYDYIYFTTCRGGKRKLFQLIYPPVIFKIYSLRLEIRIYSYKRINYSNTWSNTFELLYCNFFVQFFISNKNLKYYYQSVCSSLRRSFWFQIKIIKKCLIPFRKPYNKFVCNKKRKKKKTHNFLWELKNMVIRPARFLFLIFENLRTTDKTKNWQRCGRANYERLRRTIPVRNSWWQSSFL